MFCTFKGLNCRTKMIRKVQIECTICIDIFKQTKSISFMVILYKRPHRNHSATITVAKPWLTNEITSKCDLSMTSKE